MNTEQEKLIARLGQAKVALFDGEEADWVAASAAIDDAIEVVRRAPDEQAEVVGLTADDQQIMHQSLRSSVKIIASPSPAVAAGGVTEALKQARKFIADDFGDASDAHDILAVIDAALAVGDEGMQPDLLAVMAKHPGWSIERGYKDRGDDEGGPYGWCVYEVRGGRSDLEWDLIGFGETPHEALSVAVAGLPTPPSRGEGE